MKLLDSAIVCTKKFQSFVILSNFMYILREWLKVTLIFFNRKRFIHAKCWSMLKTALLWNFYLRYFEQKLSIKKLDLKKVHYKMIANILSWKSNETLPVNLKMLVIYLITYFKPHNKHKKVLKFPTLRNS